MDPADSEIVSEIVQLLSMIILWAGGFLAAPLLFMATLGVFRNLAGMSTSSFRKITGKVSQPGRKRRDWGRAEREGLRQERFQNKGATRWNTRRRKMQEGYREASRSLNAKEQLHEDLTTPEPTPSQARARRGMSDKVLRQAKAEQSREDMAQASYAMEAAGANVSGERFEIYDKNGNQINSTDQDGLWGKDDMLVHATEGAKVINSRSKATVADGGSGGQRAAANILAQQGLVEPLRKIQDNIDQKRSDAQQLLAQGDTQGAQAYAQEAAELQTTLSEAIQSNVGSIMPKADDLVKGSKPAFSRITADKIGTYDKSTLSRAVNWLSDNGTEEQMANFRNQLDIYLSDPKRYGSQSGEALLELKNTIANASVPQTNPNQQAVSGQLQELRDRINSPPAGKPTINTDGTVG